MAKSKQSHLNTQYLTAPFSIEGAKTILFRDSNLFRSGNLAKQILGPMLSPLLPSRHPRGVRWLLRCQSCCYAAAVLLPSIPSTQRTITTAASMRLLALLGWLLSPFSTSSENVFPIPSWSTNSLRNTPIQGCQGRACSMIICHPGSNKWCRWL